MFTNFYNGSIRRMVVAFGSLFNQLHIDKIESDGTKTLLVPIAYAAKEKYKVRLASDPYFQNPNQITLPRMAFDITGYMYDGARKRNTLSRHIVKPTTSSPSELIILLQKFHIILTLVYTFMLEIWKMDCEW